MTLYDRVFDEDELDEGIKERLAALALGAACVIGSPGCSSTGHVVSEPESFAAPQQVTHPLDREANEFFGSRALEASRTAKALGRIGSEAPAAIQKVPKPIKVDPKTLMLSGEKPTEEPETSDSAFISKITQ